MEEQTLQPASAARKNPSGEASVSPLPPAPSRDAPEALVNRELSWLAFARRVLELVEQHDLPLLERVKFVGIMGMLHDEFFMKRASGMKRRIAQGSSKRSPDGLTPEEEFRVTTAVVRLQAETLARVVKDEIRPALQVAGVPVLDHADLEEADRQHLRRYFQDSVQPILTPLAVDAEHPFPFISNQTLNLAAEMPGSSSKRLRFVRIKVPGNRPRWVPLPRGRGWVPLEQVIAANLDLLFPETPPKGVFAFRVTRGADGNPERLTDLSVEDSLAEPGMIVRVVRDELRARRFAGCVRLQVETGMPPRLRKWLCRQLNLAEQDVYETTSFLGISDLLGFQPEGRDDLKLPRHTPTDHPRLAGLEPLDAAAIFEEIQRGDILLHHPYHSFDTSVLRFIESAARDPAVLALKLTIYRTSSDSPIVKALIDAARRGKQVAVLVEITARFDEAPNIAWGKLLEEEGVHVAYGVEHLKTHVKLAMVVREEGQRVRLYAHVGTGNYHTGTARIYEDMGILTCDPELCRDVIMVFNELTGATHDSRYARLLVAPRHMRQGFLDLIRREIEHQRAGRPAGIRAKMNQLQDATLIRALYEASAAGVPITLLVRGLCCLRPGVPGLSDNIRVFSVLGRFLEHSRIYCFENGGSQEIFTGSADWMERNLDHRIETIAPVLDPAIRRELIDILDVYERDNATAWDGRPDGTFVRRRPAEGEPRRESQAEFIRRTGEEAAHTAGTRRIGRGRAADDAG